MKRQPKPQREKTICPSGKNNMNRIEIARQYVDEQLAQRPDIVAAWLAGSVARGQETALSDIDLVLMVAGAGAPTRAGIDTWREGIYIEAGIVFQEDYSDLETVLNDPFKATHMQDALILYDPTGFVTRLQNAVRPLYMQPQWLAKRLAFWVEQLRSMVAQLQTAVQAGDALRICAALGWFNFGAVSIPLLRAGITPSSSRGLALLGQLDPSLKAQLAAFEGSTHLTAADVLALEPFLRAAIPLCDASFGQLPIYFLHKIRWMAQQGQHQEAFHAMWIYLGPGTAQSCLNGNDPASLAAGADLMQRWLQSIHFADPDRLAAKVLEAQALLDQLQA
jgi:predicted nucleotidyltransferase